MLHPLGQDGHFDPTAPISQWKTFGNPYSSRDACEQAKAGAVDFAKNQASSFFAKQFKDFGPSQLSNMEAGVSASKCVSSDEIKTLKLRTLAVSNSDLTPELRQYLRPKLLAISYADYQKKATHEIPLVELGPIGRAPALAARGGGASFLTMPKQRVGDIDIYYEVHGDGPQTLVMVRGLGSNLCAWYAQTPVLAQHFRTVVFDNRGAGRTDKPDAPYSMRQMAADAAGLMDALAIDRAALLGISMGGMIAQEFALNYPERLTALILGCTNFGGLTVVQAEPEIISAVMAGANANPAQRRLQLRASFSDATIEGRPEFLARDEKIRALYPIPQFAFMRQVQAISGHDAGARLGAIKIPTMVMAGRDDVLVPSANAKMIAEKIPGAILKELPGGHLFFTEFPELFNSLVVDFVRSVAIV